MDRGRKSHRPGRAARLAFGGATAGAAIRAAGFGAGLAAALAAAGLASAASAAPAPARPGAAERELTVTVYNQNLALVKDVRSLDLGSGRQSLRFTDVSAQIDATSVHLVPKDGGGLQILEQNFQYDLVSADRILERYVDRELDVLGKDGKVTSGNLLSYDGGNLVLGRAGGGLSIVNRTEVKEIQFPDLPGGLITKPTLAWLLENSGPARRRTQLSYLTTGLSWHAEYVAVVDAEDKNLSWTGWVSLENSSGTSYPEARLKLVAGDIHRAQPPISRTMESLSKMEAVAPSQFEEQAFFEYHLYTLERPTTLADKETKQLSLFPTASVAANRVFTYDRTKDPKKIQVTMEFKNSQAGGLGMALPAGKVRVYKEDRSGAEEFVGEDAIDHTPKDENVRLTVGNAFDVVGEYRQVSFKRISDRATEGTHEIKIRNHKKEKVRVKVVEHSYGDWTITTSSVPFEKKDATTFEFTLDVPADGEVTVTYTIRQQ